MKVVFTGDAEHNLQRLGQTVAGRIISKVLWFATHFNQQVPQPLGYRFKGLFKLRIGDWRVIYEFDRVTQILTVHLVDHRNRIYERR